MTEGDEERKENEGRKEGRKKMKDGRAKEGYFKKGRKEGR